MLSFHAAVRQSSNTQTPTNPTQTTQATIGAHTAHHASFFLFAAMGDVNLFLDLDQTKRGLARTKTMEAVKH